MKTLITMLAVIAVLLIWHPRGKKAFITFCYTYYCGFKELIEYLSEKFKNPHLWSKGIPEECKILFYIVSVIGFIFICIVESTKIAINRAFKILEGDCSANE